VLVTGCGGAAAEAGGGGSASRHAARVPAGPHARAEGREAVRRPIWERSHVMKLTGWPSDRKPSLQWGPCVGLNLQLCVFKNLLSYQVKWGAMQS